VRAWEFSREGFTGTASLYPGTDVFQPDYAGFCDALYGRQNALGSALMLAFAEMLELEPSFFFKNYVSGDLGSIRLLHYPGLGSGKPADTGISAHTDFEAFTLMHQDAPGLQFLSPANEGWIDAPVRSREFVVIIGDVLERFTNGVLKATPHRVLQTTHSRNSIIRFNAVHPDTMIEPHPSFVSAERPSRYSPVTMKRHMETTMENLRQGKGSWDTERMCSLSATYDYS
jgi:isopenicillin N synthase-like dioxygenase